MLTRTCLCGLVNHHNAATGLSKAACGNCPVGSSSFIVQDSQKVRRLIHAEVCVLGHRHSVPRASGVGTGEDGLC